MSRQTLFKMNLSATNSLSFTSSSQVNGKLTLGENIADNEGIRKAYYAYKSWTVEHGKENILPGLNYTPEQLFWIASAKIWCSKYNPAILSYLLENDYHSPSMVRVNAQVSNQKEFAKDFSCPTESRMNPTKKCHFWWKITKKKKTNKLEEPSCSFLKLTKLSVKLPTHYFVRFQRDK